MLQKSFQLFETPCSSMDRTGASSALDTGSIPVGGTLEHFSAACPVSLLRVRYSGSLRGRLHRCTMETCSAPIDPHTVFALAPCAISLKNALGPRRFFARDEAAAPVARAALNPPAARAPKRRADSGAPRSA